MASKVLLVQGTTLQFSTAECTDVSVSPLPTLVSMDTTTREVSVTGGTATENDVTTFSSTSKEFRLGLRDAGSMSISGHWVGDDAAHAALKAADADKLSRLFVVTFEDGSIWKCLGYVSQRSWAAAVDGVVTATFNIRLTGEAVEVDAP